MKEKEECNNCMFFNTIYCSDKIKSLKYPECHFNSGYNKAQENAIRMVI